MNRMISILTTLLLSLWAGSLVHTVLTVASLFKSFPKAASAVAIEAAPVVFAVTERYHVALSLLAVLVIVAWRGYGCSRAKRIMMWLAILATLLAFIQLFGFSAKMETLRRQGLSGGPEFTRFHHISTTQYMIQTLLVVGALALLPTAITSRNDRRAIEKVPESPRA